MLEAYLGPDVFRDGIRAFMREHAFSNATTHDLWEALNAIFKGLAIGVIRIINLAVGHDLQD